MHTHCFGFPLHANTRMGPSIRVSAISGLNSEARMQVSGAVWFELVVCCFFLCVEIYWRFMVLSQQTNITLFGAVVMDIQPR